MRLEILEGLPHQPVGERAGLAARLELEQQSLAQVARAHARGIELLDDAQHLFGIGEGIELRVHLLLRLDGIDRKSTRLNSSHSQISYAVFCLKKKKKIVISNRHLNINANEC